MRVLLFTGKGGVGKTSVAAATALRAASLGVRTLVMSTDPAHSLADSFGVPIGDEAAPVAPGLDAQQLDAQRRLESHWREIRTYLVTLLRWGGVSEVEAEELAIVPGLEEVFSLVDVRRRLEEDAYDLLVVDCAPTGETLRLLSLPDALSWYIERVFPVERRVARVIRPVLGRVTTMPLPADDVLGAVERLYASIEGVRLALTDPAQTSVRLVTMPERMVIAESRRSYTALSLFGYHVDAVIVNRLLPDAITDPWFGRWKQLQAEHLATIEDAFAGLPILRAPLFDEEVTGHDALGRLAAAVYGDHEPHELLHKGDPMALDRTEDGWRLCLALPFAQRGDVHLRRRNDELYVKVGGYTRSLLLPAALVRCDVVGAGLAGGELEVRFAERPHG